MEFGERCACARRFALPRACKLPCETVQPQTVQQPGKPGQAKDARQLEPPGLPECGSILKGTSSLPFHNPSLFERQHGIGRT